MALYKRLALFFPHPEKQDLFQIWSFKKTGMCTVSGEIAFTAVSVGGGGLKPLSYLLYQL